MDYEQKKKEVEEKFESIKKEIDILENTKQSKLQELLRLQGAYNLLKELSTNQKEHGNTSVN